MTQAENTRPQRWGCGWDRFWVAAAALHGAVSVAARAVAAHALDPERDAWAIRLVNTGSLSEALHALAMLALAGITAAGLVSPRPAMLAQAAFLIGNFAFPGALYAIAAGAPHWLGAAAPIGGTAFIIGWVATACAALCLARKVPDAAR